MSAVQPCCALQSSQQEQCDTFKAEEAYDRARTYSVFLCVCWNSWGQWKRRVEAFTVETVWKGGGLQRLQLFGYFSQEEASCSDRWGSCASELLTITARRGKHGGKGTWETCNIRSERSEAQLIFLQLQAKKGTRLHCWRLLSKSMKKGKRCSDWKL